MADAHGERHEPAPTADCEQVLVEIYTYLDGELTAEVRASISGHLEGCPDCLEVYDFEAELRMVISARCREQVPDSLRQRIAQLLSCEDDAPPLGPR